MQIILKDSLVIKSILLLIEVKVVSYLLIERKITCHSSMTLKLLLTVGVGVSIAALIAALLVGPYSKEHSAFALTRGTPYDDLLSSAMSEGSNQNDLALMGANSSQAGPNANGTSVFIYGDLGNDEIRGSNQSDHLGGGPGRDSVDDFNPMEGDFAVANCEILENDEKPVATP
jgi:hypothetical protein